MSVEQGHERSEQSEHWRVRFAVWAGLNTYLLTKNLEQALAVAPFVLAALQDRR